MQLSEIVIEGGNYVSFLSKNDDSAIENHDSSIILH